MPGRVRLGTKTKARIVHTIRAWFNHSDGQLIERPPGFSGLPALRGAAARAATTGALLRLVDTQGSTTHVFAIEVLNRTGRIRARHLHERKSARTAGFAVCDDIHR